MENSINPAQELYDILTGWLDQPQTNARDQRGLKNRKSINEHLRAVRCIEDARMILDIAERAGKTTKQYRKALDDAARAIFHYPNSWQHKQTEINQTSYAVLEVLPDAINSWQQGLTIPNQQLSESAPELREQISYFCESVRVDESLDQHFKRHVTRLCNHITGLIDDLENGGSFQLCQALDELFVYLNYASKISQDTKTRSAATKVQEFFYNLTMTGATGLFTGLGTAAGQGMIGPF